ncbi:MAG: hypothetical protein QM763_03095 [Agriterribacter sp.]
MQKIMQLSVYKTETGLKIIDEMVGYGEDEIIIKDVVNIPLECRVLMSGEQVNIICNHGLQLTQIVNHLYSTGRVTNGEYLRLISHVHHIYRQPIYLIK